MFGTETIFNWLFFIVFGALMLLFFLMLHMFYKEQEKPGLNKTLVIGIAVVIIGSSIYFLNMVILFYTFVFIVLIVLVLLIFPVKNRNDICDLIPIHRQDERDIMFSRRELVPGTEKYKAYYRKHPEREELDNQFRQEAGLLSSKSIYFHKYAFEKASEYFRKVDLLHNLVTGNPAERAVDIDPLINSTKIKKDIMEAGAIGVGITQTRDYHFYTHKGRGEEYGNAIDVEHQFAIAFTVEMKHAMVQAAPKASIVMESARQYLNAGKIATNMAIWIRDQGYEARAHIDGNYQVICPLVARDAGLGEIGRMGLLMTPDYGPRVRIGVISTDMPLIPDNYSPDHSVLDFCRICKKCAECCPAHSISSTDPEPVDGIRRWKINSESCFTFWCKAGTDCGRCMSVCPYSHPNHGLHKLVRWGIKRSPLFRWLALKMDDFFYGRKPKPKPLPAFPED